MKSDKTTGFRLPRDLWRNPLPIAVIVSALMLALLLISSEGQTSLRTPPPLPADVQRELEKNKQASSHSAEATSLRTTVGDADLASDEATYAAPRREQPFAGSLSQPHAAQIGAGSAPQQQSSGDTSQKPTLATSATGNEPQDLPVVPPSQRSASPASGAQSSWATTHESGDAQKDPLEEIKRYIVPQNAGTRSDNGLPVPTPPPIAVPRELAQAQAAPTRTPSVMQRVRNIPTHLIQTPYPILTNSPGLDEPSPAADPNLATDAGKAPKWSDPNHPVVKEMLGSTVPIPTLASGTPQAQYEESALATRRPSATPRNPSGPAPTETIRPQQNELMRPMDSPALASGPPGVIRETNKPTPAEGSSAGVATAVRETPSASSENTRASSTPSAPAMEKQEERQNASEEARAPAEARTAPPTPRLFEKEIRTTGEFTVRKGRAVVTFSNVPVETVATQSVITTGSVTDSPELPATVPASKITAMPGEQPSEATPRPPESLPKFEPEKETESVVEQRLQELARSGTDAKLVQRLVSKAIPASVGDRVLTREALDRHVRAFEILRGVKLNEDQRVTVEDMLAQDWLERTAVAAIARERGLSVTDDEVASEMERRKARFSQNLPKAWREAGFTEEEIMEEIRNSLLVDKLVEKTMAESYPESKLRELYEANPERFAPSRRLHLREIFKEKQPGREQEARQALEKIRMEIAKGASFEELARRESDSSTRERDGDLGWIDASKPISPRQAEALANLKAGDVSDVIELSDGFQLLKIVEIEEPKPGFEGAREAVKAAVRNRIIGMAYDEAMARYEVKLRNKRLTPRFPHPDVPTGTQAVGSAEKKPTGARSSSKNIEPRSQAKVTPAPARPLASANTAETPTPRETPENRKRLFPFLKKRNNQ